MQPSNQDEHQHHENVRVSRQPAHERFRASEPCPLTTIYAEAVFPPDPRDNMVLRMLCLEIAQGPVKRGKSPSSRRRALPDIIAHDHMRRAMTRMRQNATLDSTNSLTGAFFDAH